MENELNRPTLLNVEVYWLIKTDRVLSLRDLELPISAFVKCHLAKYNCQLARMLPTNLILPMFCIDMKFHWKYLTLNIFASTSTPYTLVITLSKQLNKLNTKLAITIRLEFESGVFTLYSNHSTLQLKRSIILLFYLFLQNIFHQQFNILSSETSI